MVCTILHHDKKHNVSEYVDAHCSRPFEDLFPISSIASSSVIIVRARESVQSGEINMVIGSTGYSGQFYTKFYVLLL